MSAGRCGNLDSDGLRCRSKNTKLYMFFGDPEMAESGECRWVAVPFCPSHKVNQSRYVEADYKRRKRIEAEER